MLNTYSIVIILVVLVVLINLIENPLLVWATLTSRRN
jgi:hypothetical protein